MVRLKQENNSILSVVADFNKLLLLLYLEYLILVPVAYMLCSVNCILPVILCVATILVNLLIGKRVFSKYER